MDALEDLVRFAWEACDFDLDPASIKQAILETEAAPGPAVVTLLSRNATSLVICRDVDGGWTWRKLRRVGDKHSRSVTRSGENLSALLPREPLPSPARKRGTPSEYIRKVKVEPAGYRLIYFQHEPT